MSTTEQAADIMPQDWHNPLRVGFQVSLAALDEFGFPIDRRGIKTNVPSSPSEYAEFATKVAETVRKTILYTLTGEVPE